MRAGIATAAIKIIGSKAGNKAVVKTTAGEILNIDQRIASGVTTAGPRAIGVIKINRHSCIRRSIADAIMRTGCTGTAIKIIGGKTGDKAIVKNTAGQILNIGKTVTRRRTAAGTRTIGVVQVNRDTRIRSCVTDSVMRTGSTDTTIKIIGRKAGDKKIVKAATGEILNIN